MNSLAKKFVGGDQTILKQGALRAAVVGRLESTHQSELSDVFQFVHNIDTLGNPSLLYKPGESQYDYVSELHANWYSTEFNHYGAPKIGTFPEFKNALLGSLPELGLSKAALAKLYKQIGDLSYRKGFISNISGETAMHASVGKDLRLNAMSDLIQSTFDYFDAVPSDVSLRAKELLALVEEAFSQNPNISNEDLQILITNYVMEGVSGFDKVKLDTSSNYLKESCIVEKFYKDPEAFFQQYRAVDPKGAPFWEMKKIKDPATSNDLVVRFPIRDLEAVEQINSWDNVYPGVLPLAVHLRRHNTLFATQLPYMSKVSDLSEALSLSLKPWLKISFDMQSLAENYDFGLKKSQDVSVWKEFSDRVDNYFAQKGNPNASLFKEIISKQSAKYRQNRPVLLSLYLLGGNELLDDLVNNYSSIQEMS